MHIEFLIYYLKLYFLALTFSYEINHPYFLKCSSPKPMQIAAVSSASLLMGVSYLSLSPQSGMRK